MCILQLWNGFIYLIEMSLFSWVKLSYEKKECSEVLNKSSTFLLGGKLHIEGKQRWISVTYSSVCYSSVVQFAFNSLGRFRALHEVFGQLAKDGWIILSHLSRTYTKPIPYLAHRTTVPKLLMHVYLHMLELFDPNGLNSS